MRAGHQHLWPGAFQQHGHSSWEGCKEAERGTEIFSFHFLPGSSPPTNNTPGKISAEELDTGGEHWQSLCHPIHSFPLLLFPNQNHFGFIAFLLDPSGEQLLSRMSCREAEQTLADRPPSFYLPLMWPCLLFPWQAQSHAIHKGHMKTTRCVSCTTCGAGDEGSAARFSSPMHGL